jgi:F-type H+-transporting ATPase subunit b
LDDRIRAPPGLKSPGGGLLTEDGRRLLLQPERSMTRIARVPLLTFALLLAGFGVPATAAPEVEKSDSHGAAAADAGDHHGGPEASLLRPAAEGFITALTTLIVFLGLVVILGKFAWGPISKGLQDREDKIRRDIEEAEAARARAEATQREYAAQLATAEAKVRELLAKANADAEQIAGNIRMRAQQEAQEAKESATREIGNAQRDAVRQVHEQAAVLSTKIAEKILRRNLNPDDQRDLVQSSLEQLETIKA